MPPVRPVPSSITSLTDQELADSLRKYGVNLGPILPTTRRVYERKLYQLETGMQASPSSTDPPVEDEDDEDEDETGAAADEDSADDEVTLQHQPRQRTTRTSRTEYSVRTEINKPLPRKPLHSGISQTTSPLYSSTPVDRRSKTASSQRKTKESSGGLPWWVKLLAILIVAAIVFLVIKNMEPNPASSIPDQIEVNV